METNKCKSCKFGGVMEGFWGSIYYFAQAHKKDRIIKYSKGECGCRMDEWQEKEILCLSNNFSEYVEFILL
jgi:hypothetical protein